MTDQEIADIMRPFLNKTDGGYAMDMGPEYVVAGVRAVIERQAAQIAELIEFNWQQGNQNLDLKKIAQRYDRVRRLTPNQFFELWDKCLKGAKFDELVDDLLSPVSEHL